MDLQDERILLTGGAGFLGVAIQRELLQSGLRPEDLAVPRRKEFDLTKEADVVRVYDATRPTIVIHLAAEVGGIGANRANPGRFFYANMAMGLHLIEHARLRGLKKFVQVGTVCAYPKFTPIPFKEEDLWNGYPEETNAPYGVAKKALLVMLDAYRAQYGLNGIFLLPANLYGPGDNFDLASSHVIPALIRKFQQAVDEGQEEVVVWGTGKASREFLYVDDAARGVVAATRGYDKPEPVNLGANFEITIEELAGKIREFTGFGGRLAWDTTQPDGQPRRRVDAGRAEREFGFRATMGLEDGLRETIAWYRAHRHRIEARAR